MANFMSNFLRKLNPFDTASSANTTQRGKVYPNQLNRLYEILKVEMDRKKAYSECWVMYSDDARIAASIDTTAGSATNGGFTIHFNKAKTSDDQIISDADEIIDNIKSKTGLDNMLSGIAKEMLILGDVFLEVVVDLDTNEIVNLKKLPARTIERIEDDFGQLTGYLQRNELREVIMQFMPWQILHMRWNHFSGQKYGTSMLKSIRGTYKKLKMTEEDLVIRRRTRAGVKLHHYGASADNPLEPDEVDEYITANTNSPLNVRTDWYSNGKWKIDVLKSDDGVSQIEDIKHLEDILFVGLRTPKGLLGIAGSGNRSGLERQEVAYIRLLNEICEEIGGQLTQVFDLGIALKGLDPEAVEYRMTWDEKTIEDSNKKTERLVLLGNTGYISRQTATSEMGYNYADEQLKIDAEVQAGENIDYASLRFQEFSVGPITTNTPAPATGDIAHNSGNSNNGASKPTISKQQIPAKNKTVKTGAAKR